LGIIFANANEKTILVEADMRRNRMAQSLGLENEDGLSSYLAGTASLDQVIQKTSVPNFSVIVSGPRPPNPTELLTSAKTKDLLAGLKSRFDRVILDSPPVLTVADAVILANVVDGVIEVIQAGFLNIDIILKGRQRLFEAKAKVIGVILNKVNVKSEDAYYYYHYYYTEDTVKKV
jgi:capsular exopolysaccharide synthesis family protein